VSLTPSLTSFTDEFTNDSRAVPARKPTIRHLQSLPILQHLRIVRRLPEEFDQWTEIIEGVKQNTTLRTFDVDLRPQGRHGFEYIESLSASALSLEQLTIQTPPLYGKSIRDELPPFTRLIAQLKIFPNLISLRLIIYCNAVPHATRGGWEGTRAAKRRRSLQAKGEKAIANDMQYLANHVFSELRHPCPRLQAIVIEPRSPCGPHCFVPDGDHPRVRLGYVREMEKDAFGDFVVARRIDLPLLRHYVPRSEHFYDWDLGQWWRL
jgi:hypothetical protein